MIVLTWRHWLLLLIGAAAVHFSLWYEYMLVDGDMWSNQAHYMVTHDPRGFDISRGYAYPGTTILWPTIFLARMLSLPYLTTLRIVLALWNALTVVAASYLAFRLRPSTWWWLVPFCFLIANRLYLDSVPASIVAMPLLTVLFLLTWWLYEHAPPHHPVTLLWWGILAGSALATRADISSFVIFALLLVLLLRLGWQQVTLAVLFSGSVFLLTDPYLWTTPWQHVIDMLHKVTFHYAGFVQHRFSYFDLFLVSPLSFLVIGWTGALLVKRRPLPGRVPRMLVLVLLAITFVVGLIVFNSGYQSTRYFHPFIGMWEMVAALFLLETVPHIPWGRFHPSLYRQHLIPLLFFLIFIPHFITFLWYSYWLDLEWAFTYYLGWYT